MLTPKNTKYRKAHKGRIHGNANRGSQLAFGIFGLKALEPARITAQQIEASRRVLARSIKKIGESWIRIFPDVPVSKKPAEVRMGKGKGSIDHYACRVQPGRILFEITVSDPEVAKEALTKASLKLPIRTKIIYAILEN